MREVAVLRPEPAGSRTVERARALGLQAFSLPLFRVVPRPWELPDLGEADGLLLTSANGVLLAGERLQALEHLPAHTVGDATAAAAREAGLTVATVGNGGVDRLLATLPPDLRLVHLCGEDRRPPHEPRQEIAPLVVYAAEPVEQPDLARLGGALALVHSPRAGARLAELLPDRATIAIAAISPAAAAACRFGWEQVRTAERPDDAALLSLAAGMCQSSRLV